MSKKGNGQRYTWDDVAKLERSITELEAEAEEKKEEYKFARYAVDEAIVQLREMIKEISTGQTSLLLEKVEQ